MRGTDKGTGDAEADRRAIERVLGGDPEAFDEIARRCYPAVVRTASRFFRRRELIEEVAQDVFVRAFQGLGGFRGEVPIEHWLTRITVNACYDELRKKKHRPEVNLSEITENPEEFYGRLRSPRENPGESYWDKEEARLAAEKLLSMLSAPERLVLTLMVLEDRSVADVAKITGWSRANVKIRAFRARKRLRSLLEEGGGGGLRG